MAGSDSRFDPRFDPAFQPPTSGEGPLVVDDPEPLFEHPVPASKATPDAATVAPVEPTAARRGFNPWLALLWALGLTLSVTGIWAEWYVQNNVVLVDQAPTVEEFYVIPAVLSAFSPWLTIVGIAAVVCAVYLHASEWQRQRAA